MPFQPEIAKDNIAQIVDYDQSAVKSSTKYDAIIGGKAYPPKHLIRLTHLKAKERSSGNPLW